MGLGDWVRLGFQEQPEMILWRLTSQSGRHRSGKQERGSHGDNFSWLPQEGFGAPTALQN